MLHLYIEHECIAVLTQRMRTIPDTWRATAQEHALSIASSAWRAPAGTMATGSGSPSVQALSSALAVAIAQHVGGANNQSSNASLAPPQAAPTVQHAPQPSTSGSAGGGGGAEPSRYVLPLMNLKNTFPCKTCDLYFAF